MKQIAIVICVLVLSLVSGLISVVGLAATPIAALGAGIAALVSLIGHPSIYDLITGKGKLKSDFDKTYQETVLPHLKQHNQRSKELAEKQREQRSLNASISRAQSALEALQADDDQRKPLLQNLNASLAKSDELAEQVLKLQTELQLLNDKIEEGMKFVASHQVKLADYAHRPNSGPTQNSAKGAADANTVTLTAPTPPTYEDRPMVPTFGVIVLAVLGLAFEGLLFALSSDALSGQWEALGNPVVSFIAGCIVAFINFFLCHHGCLFIAKWSKSRDITKISRRLRNTSKVLASTKMATESPQSDELQEHVREVHEKIVKDELEQIKRQKVFSPASSLLAGILLISVAFVFSCGAGLVRSKATVENRDISFSRHMHVSDNVPHGVFDSAQGVAVLFVGLFAFIATLSSAASEANLGKEYTLYLENLQQFYIKKGIGNIQSRTGKLAEIVKSPVRTYDKLKMEFKAGSEKKVLKQEEAQKADVLKSLLDNAADIELVKYGRTLMGLDK